MLIAGFYALQKMGREFGGREAGREVSRQVLAGDLCQPSLLERCAAAERAW